MEKQNRRSFFKSAGLLTATIAGASTKSVKASPENILSEDRMGVLVDTTTCIGCRNCEWACKKTHNLPAGELNSYEDKSVFKEMRRPDSSALTVVNQYENEKRINFPINVKVQCMHCDHPACVSACIVGAFSKKENGSVVWDTDKCIGCRYCMAACPYHARYFNWEEPEHTPEELAHSYSHEQPWPHHKGVTEKCEFCLDHAAEGRIPPCAKVCPTGVIYYGDRYQNIVKSSLESVTLTDMLEKRHARRFKEELGTEPNVYYLFEKEVIE